MQYTYPILTKRRTNLYHKEEKGVKVNLGQYLPEIAKFADALA
jgi:hypothetical protein